MLNEQGKRMLAYVTTLEEIIPIEGYDRVELGRVGGWRCIINKADEMKVGDKVVYFEIDSKVPATEQFAFLEKRNYKIRTLKMCKTISQGLIMPLRAFTQFDYDKTDVGTDLTDALGVKYAEADDEARKNPNPESKYKSMKGRHPFIFRTTLVKWLMKREWGRKVMFFFFGKKKDKPKEFPSFVKKTDEERVENMPWVLNDHDKKWVATEKLDGTSCTYAMKRLKKNKYEFYVCSRNVRQKDRDQECYHSYNIYWAMADKYNIEQRLKEWLDTHMQDEWICIQGEGVGSVQGNPLKQAEDDLYLFNFITSSSGRFTSFQGRDMVSSWGMKWVPILGLVTLPATMEEMKATADGKSQVNPEVLREGIVYRSLDGKESFKNVSVKYLLKEKE